MVIFNKKRTVLALLTVGVIILSICLFRPIKYLNPEQVAAIRIVCAGLPEQEVIDADRMAIVESINDIFIFIPDFRVWKNSLAGNTLDTQIVIQETTGKIIRIKYSSNPASGGFSVCRDSGFWTDWLISIKQGNRLHEIITPYILTAVESF